MEVEWIVIADGAEVVNNKVYILGGGWDILSLSSPLPVVHPCAVVASFVVPPSDDPSRAYSIGIRIIDEQSETELVTVLGQIEAIWTPGDSLRRTHRIPVAVKFGLAIEHAGRYIVRANIEGENKDIDFVILSRGEGSETPSVTPKKSRRPRKSVGKPE